MIRSLQRLVLLGTVLLLVGGACLAGSTYYVATTGNNTTGDGSAGDPWATVKHGVGQLQAGDTLVVKGGLYRESYINNFNSGTGENARITVKGAPGEKVVVSSMVDASDESLWEQVSGNVYRYKNAVGTTYRNVSQDGVPLRLMVLYSDFAGASTDLTAEGQWSRNQSQAELWVWAKGGGNPGQYNVEVSNAVPVFQIPRGKNYIVIENITAEGGYYPFDISGNYITIRNCVSRNCFGDGIKVEGCDARTEVWNSVGGVIENCDVYNFGESGIDITGGDNWTVRNCTVHHSVKNRYFATNNGCKNNGLMLKNENNGNLIEGNRLFAMETAFGAIGIGGNSSYNNCPVAKDMVVRNNIIHDVSGPYAVAFIGAENCKFYNNIVYNCDVDDAWPKCIVEFRYGIAKDSTFIHSSDNKVFNNVFYNNSAVYNYSEYTQGSDDGLELDYNLADGTRSSFFDGSAITHANMILTKGYDEHGSTAAPTFVDWSKQLVRLASGSAGVDAGKDVRADVPSDYDGVGRFLATAMDFGPYETRTASSYTVYSDGTATTGWVIPSGLGIDVVSDTGLDSSVLELEGDGSDTYWKFDDQGNAWDNTKQFVVTFKLKASDRHYAQIRFRTKTGYYKSVKWYSWYTTTDFTDPALVRFPLGGGSNDTEDGNWHTYTFDVLAALKQAQPTEEIDFIERFYTCGGVRLDDLELHNTVDSAKTPKGCIGKWTFNEGTGGYAEDSSGSGKHGTLTNMPCTDPLASRWTIGRTTKALRFGGDATHTYVTCGTMGADYSKGFTCAAWVRYDNTSDTYKAIVAGIAGYNTVYPRIFQQADRIQLQLRLDGGTLVTVNSNTGVIESGQWVHVATVVDMTAKTARVYLNGQEQTSGGAVSLSAYSALDTGTSDLRIGGDHISSHTFNGSIDGVQLYNRALRTEEIALLAAQ